MKAVTAEDVREDVVRILNDLETTGEPIVITEGRTARGVLISVGDLKRHFSEREAQERRQVLQRVRRMRVPASDSVDTVEMLRRLRGYAPSVAGP